LIGLLHFGSLRALVKTVKEMLGMVAITEVVFCTNNFMVFLEVIPRGGTDLEEEEGNKDPQMG